MDFGWERLAVDAATGARRGRLQTTHGSVETPAFMPVGTHATVKGVLPEQLRPLGVEMILANTYHLALRPGEEIIRDQGGLHRFMQWDGPILTDSGGFQVYSLADAVRITEEGAEFKSHIDGRPLHLTPERAVAIQEALGSDVAMQLDHVVPLPSPPEQVRDACERSLRWARRCQDARTRSDQVLFGIVQGGLDADLRAWHAAELTRLDLPGYAVGGLSVGEPPAEMYRILEATCPELPEDRPRYLMGVGRPEDLLEAIRRGVDLFDCVMPTRNGRNALAFTDAGPLRLRNAQFERDERPLDEATDSPASRFSRAYLRHLFKADEMLGPMLLTLHNVAYYERLMNDARRAIEAGRFAEFHAGKQRDWVAGDAPRRPRS